MELISAHCAQLVNLNGSATWDAIQTALQDIIKIQHKDFANNVTLHAYIVMAHMLRTVQNAKAILLINIYF